MSRPGKDAFLAPPPKPVAGEEGEGAKPGRGVKDWGRRLFVDGVEVDPETMQPLNPTEE